MKETYKNISRFNGRVSTLYPFVCKDTVAYTTVNYPFTKSTSNQSPKYANPISSFSRFIHSDMKTELIGSGARPAIESEESDRDETMNDFLSRFVWIMRGKLFEAFPSYDKKSITDMLLIIIERVVLELEKGGFNQMLGERVAPSSDDFSEDLWKMVWDICSKVLVDMQKEAKKEKMKEYLQSEEVKQMYRFAGEIGIRGEMLRELRFKWAREKMEESEFYQGLERLRAEEAQLEKQEGESVHTVENDLPMGEEKPTAVAIPKRHGKIKYKIYGLDLSGPEWAKAADKIHEMEEITWPQEPKPISGKCKLVTEKIISLKEGENPVPLLVEWIELLQPNRIDWIALLNRVKERNNRLYLKIAELVLGEESFKTNVRDYAMLIEAHAKQNRLKDTERILKKMTEKGIQPDILTFTVLVHMYSKAGNIEKAKEAFESLRSQNFQPDMRIYDSMIMAYVNAGQHKMGESLMREMEARDMKPTMEIYISLLHSFSKNGDVAGAQRIANTMQFAGFQHTLESCTLLIEAFAHAGDPDQAKANFDYMINIGLKPSDQAIAGVLVAYDKKNMLDKAFNFILELEKEGCELGPNSYSVLVDWFGKMELIDEAEYMLGKIGMTGESPPVKLHVSLCDMYARARAEKKALQALGVVEAKKEELGPRDFERVILGLLAGRFVQDARRVHGLMEAQGFVASDRVKVALMASQAVGVHRKQPNR